MSPWSFTLTATPQQIADIRTKLGVSNSLRGGTLENADGIVDWEIVSGGVQVTVQALYGFVNAHAPHELVESHIRQMIGL